MIKNNRNNEQIYGRNDMIMLDPNNKIYGSLGLADNYVMKTEEGTRLILSNPKLGSFANVLTEFNMYGRSEQKQYKGINLFPPNTKKGDFVEVSIPKGSPVFWATDGTLATGGNFRFFNEDKTEDMWFGVDAGATSTIKSLTIDAKYVQNLLTVDFDLSKICLGVGTEPIYEPYVGGKPSPSPDYPQEIKSIENPTVKVCGKNLLDCRSALSRTVGGISFINNKDGSFSISGKNTLSYNAYDIEFMVSQSGTYKAYRGTNSPIPIVIIYDPEARENVAVITDSGETFQLKKGKLYYYSIAFTDVSSDIDVTYKPFLTVDVTGTYADYEPYTEQSIVLPYTLNAIPVSSGGNVTIDGQQYIADYVDVEKGKVVRKIDKIVLTGEERWEMGFENWATYPYAFRLEGLKNVLGSNAMNAKYSWYEKHANMQINSLNAPYDNCIAVSDSRFSTVDEFTNELKKQNSNGNPLIVYYVMITPQEEINLAPEVIEQYKKLSVKAQTTIIENNYNTWMKATYKSTESV